MHFLGVTDGMMLNETMLFRDLLHAETQESRTSLAGLIVVLMNLQRNYLEAVLTWRFG